MYVDRRHFSIINQLFYKDGVGWCIKLGELPTRRHVPLELQWTPATPTQVEMTMGPVCANSIEAQQSRLDDLKEVGCIRNILLKLKVPFTEDNMAVMRSGMDAFAQIKQESASVEQPLKCEDSVAPSVLPSRSYITRCMIDNVYCSENTGEPLYASIVALHAYLNADNVWDSMHLTPEYQAKKHNSNTVNVDNDNAAKNHRHSILTGVEHLFLFLLLGRKNLANVDSVCSFAFESVIQLDTAWRYYDTAAAFLNYFSRHQQPLPSFENLKSVVSAKHESLVAKRGAVGAVPLSGDCTGIPVQDPSKRNLHTLLFDEYYSGPVLKIATIVAGNGVLIMPLTVSGPCDDEDCLINMGAPEVLGCLLADAKLKDNMAMLAMIYDKGLGSYYAFEKYGLFIIIPNKKKQHQLLFGHTSQEGGREGASSRIIVENINDDLKLYDMVSRKKYLASLDMEEHELNAARFLVNLKSSVNSWSSQTVT